MDTRERGETTTWVYEQIRSHILGRKIAPGSKINQNAMAEEMKTIGVTIVANRSIRVRVVQVCAKGLRRQADAGAAGNRSGRATSWR